MLRLAKKEQTYDVTFNIQGEDTVFVLKSMSIADRQDLLMTVKDLSSKSSGVAPFDILVDALQERIVRIEGYEGDVRDTLFAMEHIADLMEVTKQLIEFASLTDEQEKNSPSSSGRSIAASAGNAATNVKARKGRASTIQTKTEPFSPKVRG